MTLIKSTDARRAVEIAKTTIPCSGSLKEVFTESEGKPQTAMCVMGCLVQAISERRKQSFATISAQIGDEQSVACELDETLGVGNLVDINDTRINLDADTIFFSEDLKLSDYKTEIKKSRSLQVELLTNLAKKLEKREKLTGTFLSVSRGIS